MNDPLEAITSALEIARWAPSSHNSQPWQVEIGKADAEGIREVTVLLDETARLRALKTLDTEMAMSLGIFVGVMCRAMTVAGVSWQCRDLPPCRVILRVGPPHSDTPADLSGFTAQMMQRRTSRAPFRPKALSSDQAAALQHRTWEGLGLGLSAHVELYHGHTTSKRVAALVAHYGKLDFSNYAAWSETYAHIRFCPAAHLRDGRGFSIESLLGPMSAMKRFGLRLVLHPVSIQLLRPFGIPRVLAGSLAELTRNAPSVVVLTAQKPIQTFADLVETGSRLAELWLTATCHNIQIHPLSVLLQHKAPREALRAALGLAGIPLFVARIGEHNTPALQTPRIGLDAILRCMGPDGTPTVPVRRPDPLNK